MIKENKAFKGEYCLVFVFIVFWERLVPYPCKAWPFYTNFPYWSAYISLNIWENSFNNQDNSSFVIISLTLMTSLCCNTLI